MRWKRENLIEVLEDEFEEDTNTVSNKTGLEPWMVLAIVGIVFLAFVVGAVFCIKKFFAKKRTKKETNKKESDEQALVEGVEEVDVLEEETAKV